MKFEVSHKSTSTMKKFLTKRVRRFSNSYVSRRHFAGFLSGNARRSGRRAEDGEVSLTSIGSAWLGFGAAMYANYMYNRDRWVGCQGYFFRNDTGLGKPSPAMTRKVTMSSLWKKGKVDDHYKLTEMLAEGGRGIIFGGTHKETGDTVAIKRLPKADTPIEIVEKETKFAHIMGEEDSDIFVRIYGVYQDAKYYYIVSDFAEGVELYEHLVERLCDVDDPLTDDEIRVIMDKVCHTVAKCHLKNIVHCDIKFENFMFTQDEKTGEINIKLLDFGEAKFKSEDGLLGSGEALTGTPAYMSPELIVYGMYGEASDMWAVGVMLHVLLTRGDLPFDETKILAGECPEFALLPEIWDGVSAAGAEMCKNLLEQVPEKRHCANDCLCGDFIGGEAETTKIAPVRIARPLQGPLRNQFTDFSQRKFLAPRSEANRVVVKRQAEAPTWLPDKFADSMKTQGRPKVQIQKADHLAAPKRDNYAQRVSTMLPENFTMAEYERGSTPGIQINRSSRGSLKASGGSSMKRNLFKRQDGQDHLGAPADGPVGNSAEGEGNNSFAMRSGRRKSVFGDALSGRNGLFSVSPTASSRAKNRELSRGKSWANENGFYMERTEAAEKMHSESKGLLRRSSFDVGDSTPSDTNPISPVFGRPGSASARRAQYGGDSRRTVGSLPSSIGSKSADEFQDLRTLFYLFSKFHQNHLLTIFFSIDISLSLHFFES